MDILFLLQSTVRSMQIRMLQMSKEKNLFFNKFHLIFIYLFVPIMKKIVTKYVVCFSNNSCFKG